MAKLYFENSKGERKHIADINKSSEIFHEIHKHIDKCNEVNKKKGCREFQWFYTRLWYNEEDNETHFDVGSHTEFFIAEGDWTNKDEETDE